MMQKLRNPYVMKWGMWIILGITIPSFVLFYGFGKGDRATHASGPLVTLHTDEGTVKLGEQDLRIAKNEAANYYFDLLSMFQRMQPEEQRRAWNSLQRALENKEVAEFAISQVALRQRLDKQDIRVTENQVSKYLAAQGLTREGLQQILRANNMTEAEYTQSRRRELQEEMAASSVTRLARTSLLELYNEYLIFSEQLNASVVRIPIVPDPSLEVADTEIEARYQELVAARDGIIIDPAKRTYEYVKLALPAMRVPEASEERLREEYDKAPADDPELHTDGAISVRHILVSVAPSADEQAREAARAKAIAARGRLAAGEPFATIANEVSDDPRNVQYLDDATSPTLLGGLITNSLKGDEIDIWGEEWIRTINQAELKTPSNVIETPQGYSIVQVERRSDPGKLPFDQVRTILQTRLRQELTAKANEEREQLAAQELRRLREAESAEATLEGIARAVKGSVETTSPTITNQTFIPGIGNMMQERELLENLKPAKRTPAIQNSNLDPVVFQVKEEIPEKIRTLADVHERIANLIRRERAEQSAIAEGERLKERVKANDSLTSAAAELNLAAATIEPFPRAQLPQDLRGAQDLPFQLIASRKGDVFVAKSGSLNLTTEVLVVKVDDVKTPPMSEFIDSLQLLEGSYLLNKRRGYIEEFRRDALSHYKAEYNPVYFQEDDAAARSKRAKGKS